MTKQFTTARDIAELLNLTLPRIYEVTRKGLFPTGVVVRIGRQIRYNRESLLNWLQEGGTMEQGGPRSPEFNDEVGAEGKMNA